MPLKYLYNHIPSSILHNGQKVERTHVSQQMNGLIRSAVYTEWNIIQLIKRMKF